DASATIETILSMDERKRKLQLELEAAQAGLNAISKEIGLLMAKGDKAGADEKKKAVASVKSGIGPIQQALDLTESQMQQLLLTLPNLPALEVPPGKSPQENIVVREGGQKPKLPAG